MITKTKLAFGISLFIAWAIIVAILIVGLLFFQDTNNSNSKILETSQISQKSQNSISPSQISLTMEEVAKHNTLNDCWFVIDNKVYDITSYSSSHPGGSQTINMGCGKDATNLYDTKGSSGGTHSTNARSLLTQFYIGELNQQISTTQLQSVENSIKNSSISSKRYEYEDD